VRELVDLKVVAAAGITSGAQHIAPRERDWTPVPCFPGQRETPRAPKRLFTGVYARFRRKAARRFTPGLETVLEISRFDGAVARGAHEPGVKRCVKRRAEYRFAANGR